MIMTIENKRRELFEAYCVSDAGGYCKEDLERDAEGNYTVVWDYWDAWNAALDAVVIQLPEKCDVEEWSESFITFHGEGYSKELIIETIQSTGLGLKVLP